MKPVSSNGHWHMNVSTDGKLISDLIAPVGRVAWLSSWLHEPRWPDDVLYAGLKNC